MVQRGGRVRYVTTGGERVVEEDKGGDGGGACFCFIYLHEFVEAAVAIKHSS